MNVGLLLHRYLHYRLRSLLYFFLLVVDMLFVTILYAGYWVPLISRFSTPPLCGLPLESRKSRQNPMRG